MKNQVAGQRRADSSTGDDKNRRSSTGSFIDARPQTVAQNAVGTLMNNGPRAAQFKAQAAGIRNSPRMTVQRQQMQGIAVATAQASPAVQRMETMEAQPSQVRREFTAPMQLAAGVPASPPPAKPNHTGLPDQLKSGIESMSGMSMDHVKVHYGSSQPAQLNAHAYAQGSEIHIGPGQEQHLPHEAWHVVQQAQGRVPATTQMAGMTVNNDGGLEKEADVMGAKALAGGIAGSIAEPEKGYVNNGNKSMPTQQKAVIQRLAGMEIELCIPFYNAGHTVETDDETFISPNADGVSADMRTAIVNFLYGGLTYGQSYGQVAGRYDISADHESWQKKHGKLREHIEYTHIETSADTPMTNLEYRTTAQEERAAAGETATRDTAAQVRAHAVDSAARASAGVSGNLAAPVAGLFTGIPVAALRALLHGDAEGLALFDTMNTALDPTVYFQTTVGSLPSEIPGLFNEAADDIDAGSANNPKAGLLRQSVARAIAALADAGNAALVGTFPSGAKQSLLGWMTLVAEYLMAYRLETTSYRYRINIDNGRLRRKSGINKNLVPYLSKTLLINTVAALPPSVRPNIADGAAHRDAWLALLDSLAMHCEPPTFDIAVTLGLEDYEGQLFYNEAGIGIRIAHEEVMHPAPRLWLPAMLQGMARVTHVAPGAGQLPLDGNQQALHPDLNIPEEQAIPLEDRASQVKGSFGDSHDIAHIDGKLNTAWDRAKARRLASTAARTAYRLQHVNLNNAILDYGTLVPLIPALNAFRVRHTALAGNPPDLPPSERLLNQLHLDFTAWQALNSHATLALSLLRPLINKAGWTEKGKRFLLPNKVPDGVRLLREALNAGNAPAATLTALETIGRARLATGTRLQVTTDMYELVRDVRGWLGNTVGLNQFVTKYNTTNGGV